MANINEKKSASHPIEFSDTFHTSLKEILDEYTSSLSVLEKSHGTADGYGVCNSTYKMRYITPNNVSTYISNLSKAMTNNLVGLNASDIEMFTVASVMRFMDENGCVPFNDTSVINLYGKVNPQVHTLRDLLVMVDNDVVPSTIYSYEEIVKRQQLVKDDIKVLNDLHFDAVVRNIISGFPAIASKVSHEPVFSQYSMRKLFLMFIEEFILFASTLNTITAKSIVNYVAPRAEYVSKKKDVDSVVEYVTECCLLKTNNMRISSNLPFDCNFRSIVLQDVSPKFADVKNAIEFIINDARSPISTLIRRHLPIDDGSYNTYQDIEIISDLLFKDKNQKSSRGQWSHIIDRNKNVTSDPYEDVCFNTELSWLDTITFGNNYLDCNYRRDTTGNHAFSPVDNTIGVIHKMYCGYDLKSNEELAANIKRVSNVMGGIINAYSDYRIENHELVRDILCVLGEILTRNILKLFHNNTRIIPYDDSMTNTMIPGYLYSESFVMEAEDNKPSVSISGKNGGKAITPKIKNISDLLRKFVDWVLKTFPKVAEKFNQNHKAEMDFIKKNDVLNKEIEEALASGKLQLNVSNIPKFNIPGKEILDTTKIGTVVDEFLKTDKEFTKEDVLKRMYPGNESVGAEIASKQNEADKVAALTNYLLYGKTSQGELINGVLQVNMWKDICSDLINTDKLIDQTAKKYAEEVKKAGENLARRQREIEAEANKANTAANAQQNGQPSVSAPQPKVDGATKLKILTDAIQEITKTFGITMINVFNSKFYAVNYKIYRDVINVYQQQKTTQDQKG